MDILATISMLAKSWDTVSAKFRPRDYHFYLAEPGCMRFRDVPVVHPVSIVECMEQNACEAEKTDLRIGQGAIISAGKSVDRALRR